MLVLRRFSALLLPLFVAATLVVLPGRPAVANDSMGSEFWIAFPGNHNGAQRLSLFITSEVAASGTVSVPGVGFSEDFSTTPGAITEVTLPSSVEIFGNDTVSDQGVHVTSDQPVTVYGLTLRTATSDAYLALPLDVLGTDHVIASYQNAFSGSPSQLAVVGTDDDTTVTITPATEAGGHPAGVPFDVVLNEGQTYALSAPSFGADLTGTTVVSDRPVAVFGGARCTNIPTGFFACDTIVEQLTPTTAWGTRFATVPLATRVGDTFRVIAGTDNTTVSIDGEAVATINRGQFIETVLTDGAEITADQRVFLAQYSNSSTFDGVTGDPFMMMNVPVQQFLSSYTIATPGTQFVRNFVNVVAPDAAVGDVTLDGAAIPASDFTPIGTSGYSGAQVEVSQGTHNLEGPSRFGITVYGFNSFDSYGYPGGMNVLDLENCPEDGLDALHDTALDGVVSGTIHEEVEPLATGVNPILGSTVHTVNCALITTVEDAADGLLPAGGVPVSTSAGPSPQVTGLT